MKRLLLLLLLAANVAYPGTTGKIAGRVLEKSSRQPLPSVNVQIVGTGYGAVTDADGNYFILNIPVGTYSVRASMVGYAQTTVQDVKVMIDMTTTIDFGLESSDVRLSDVVVRAERRTIQQDKTSTKRTVDEETIAALPVDDFREIVQQQAGVVGSHFRGGRFNEALFLIDGIPVRSPVNGYTGYTGGFSANIPELSVSEIQVSTGGFEAEYGNAQSGVVNTLTRDANRLSANFRVRTSDLPGQRMAWTPFKYGKGLPDWKDYEASANTPTFDLGGFRIGLNVSADHSFQSRDFLPHEAFDHESYQGKITASTENNRIVLSALRSWGWTESYYNSYAYYGPRNMGYQQDWFQRLNVTTDPVTHVVDTSIIQYYFVADPRKYKSTTHDSAGVYTANGRSYRISQVVYQTGMQEHISLPVNQTWNVGLAWTLTIDKHSYLDVKLSSFWTRFHEVVRDVDDRNMDGNINQELYWGLNGSPSGGYTDRLYGALQYYVYTGDEGWWFDQVAQNTSLRADYSNQFNSSNLLKTGAELIYNTGNVRKVSFESPQNQRFDIWKEQLVDFSAYVQDKIEVRDGFILNAGLRVDYYNPNGFTGNVLFPADLTTLASFKDGVGLTPADKVPSRWQVSPRIGISHPITDRDKIHFYYGHFFQRPDMRYLYENVMLNFRYTTNVDIGDPRLQPEKTVSYEIGWEHLFTDDLRFNVTGYYKDITNLVGATDYVIPGSPSTYQAYVNMDYANVRGIEVQMETMGGSWIGGMLNYTWAWANGRSSTVFRSNGEIVPRRLDPLDWDIRHKINANLLMRSSGFVQDLIGDAELNFSITAQSGSPYTTNTRQVFPLFVLRNDGRLPWTSNVDARFRKSFRMANVEFSVLAEARNLLNAKNVQYISGGSDGILIWQASHNTDPTGPYNDPQAFGPPRTFRLGFQIQY